MAPTRSSNRGRQRTIRINELENFSYFHLEWQFRDPAYLQRAPVLDGMIIASSGDRFLVFNDLRFQTWRLLPHRHPAI